ncbi:MAG: type II toxin-antitoxin system Phd/YefM family antitoxin [Terriglobales bacterium]
MKEVPFSELKANCSKLVEQVRKTKKPIRITLHGKALAEILPLAPPVKRRAK